MTLSKRLLSALNLLLLFFLLLFLYSYLNNLVSYKYEVQSDQFAGNILSGHQREILNYISSSRKGSLICLIFFLVTFIINVTQPKFGGKIIYVR